MEYFLIFLIQVVISEQEPSNETQEAKVYIEKCLAMATEINDAVDIEVLNENIEQHLQLLIATLGSVLGQVFKNEKIQTELTIDKKMKKLRESANVLFDIFQTCSTFII